MKTYAPIALSSFPEGWAAERRAVIAREGFALRAASVLISPPHELPPRYAEMIEIKSLKTNEWLRLALPSDAAEVVAVFATAADRNAVLRQLTGET